MDIIRLPSARPVPGHDPSAYEDCDPTLFGEPFPLAGSRLVVTEEVPGPSVAVFFDEEGLQRLQLGGRLLGDHDRATFGLFRDWAAIHAPAFLDALGQRFVMYGVWPRVTPYHFYDLLPHLFLETDVFDRERGAFLSAEARRMVLFGLPVMPQLALHDGPIASLREIAQLLRPSLYRSSRWREHLAGAASRGEEATALRHTVDPAEPPALVLRHEAEDRVQARWRYVSRRVAEACRQAARRVPSPVRIENRLVPGVDIMAPMLELPGAYDDASAV